MFRRTLTIHNVDDSNKANVYEQVSSALLAAVCKLLNTGCDDEANWPTAEWQGDNGRFLATQWRSESSSECRLLTLQLHVKQTSREWHTILHLGCMSGAEAIWQEECCVEPTQAQFPVYEMPDLYNCLSAFTCFDTDGMRTGKTYTVDRGNLGKFQAFLPSPGGERKLPIVLISPLPGAFQYAVDPQLLARLLSGVAHVMRLNGKQAWAAKDVSDLHGCYNGAVRLYRPGYSQKDPAWVHPFCLPVGQRIKAEDLLQLLDEAITYSGAVLPEDPVLAQIRRQQQNEQTDLRSRETVMQVQRQLQAQEEHKWTDYFETIHAELESAVSERDSLRKEVEQLSDEVRRLRFRVNQQWNVSDSHKTACEATSPYLTLSGKAGNSYHDLEGSERVQVDTLFEKLLRPQSRANQSELDHFAGGGTCYIFPRSRTCSGRRIIYSLNGLEVRVCEIYTNHDEYEKARTTGWSESDYSSTTLWLAPENSGTSVE